MRRLSALTAAAALLGSAIAGHAATITTIGTTITIEGQIGQGDAITFAGHLYAAANHGQPVEAVSLNSPGGLINEGRSMADAIHAGGMVTIVNAGKMCASACFLMFAAGSQRVVGEGARIGVHSATMDLATHNDDAGSTLLMARYLGTLGVPSAIVGQLVETGSRDMAWLVTEDLNSLNAFYLDPIGVAAPQTTTNVAEKRFDLTEITNLLLNQSSRMPVSSVMIPVQSHDIDTCNHFYWMCGKVYSLAPRKVTP